MYRPLLSNKSLTSFATRAKLCLPSSMDIFSHSPFKLVHSSSTFLEHFSLALSFSNFQIFTIWFMSGLWIGHSITITSSSERNVSGEFAEWHGTLFCMNIAGWLIPVLRLGTKCFFNISLYTVWLLLPCCLTRGVLPAAEIMPNTVTLPPLNLTLFLVHCGKYCSLRPHWTKLLPSQPN